jgi:putative MFS transporter
LNLPTGFLVILLSRFIPESPRFLLLEGRIAEARKMLGKFGIELVPKQKRDNTLAPHKTSADFKQLLRQPYGILTFTICFYGAAWGLVNWGFLTSLPVILQDYMHLDPKISSTVLAKAALIAVPGSLVVTWMYGFWSSKKTMILFALLTAAALGGFSMLQIGTETNRTTLSALTVVLLIGLSGMISMLSPYSAELYPTGLRGTGGGMAASSSKAGGIIGPKAVAYVLMAFPGFFVPALSLVAPLLLATFALWKNGRETRGLRLEEIVEKGNEASSVQPIVK